MQVAWNALQATHEKEVRYDDEADLFIVCKVNEASPRSSRLLHMGNSNAVQPLIEYTLSSGFTAEICVIIVFSLCHTHHLSCVISLPRKSTP